MPSLPSGSAAPRSVSIIAEGTAAGVTELVGAGGAPTFADVQTHATIALAGRAADILRGDGANAGATSDLQAATRILAEARTRWG